MFLTKFALVLMLSVLALVAGATNERQFVKQGNNEQIVMTTVAGDKSLLVSICAAWLALIAFGVTLLFVVNKTIYAPFKREQGARFDLLRCRLLQTEKAKKMLQYECIFMHMELLGAEREAAKAGGAIKKLQESLSAETEKNLLLTEQASDLKCDFMIATEAGLELHRNILTLLDMTKSSEALDKIVNGLLQEVRVNNQLMHDVKAFLADREKSEIRLALAMQSRRMNDDFAVFKQLKSELTAEKLSLQQRSEEMRGDYERKSLKQERENDLLRHELDEARANCDMTHNELQISLAKIEILETTVRSLKTNTSVKLTDLLNAVQLRTELLVKEKDFLAQQNYLAQALEVNKQVDQELKDAFGQVKRLESELADANKLKTEAQICLNTIKSLFKDKEAEMQKEIVAKSLSCLKLNEQVQELRGTIFMLLKNQESQNNAPYNAPHQHSPRDNELSLVLPPPPFFLPYSADPWNPDVTPDVSRSSLTFARMCADNSELPSSRSEQAPRHGENLERVPSQHLRSRRQLFPKMSKLNLLADA